MSKDLIRRSDAIKALKREKSDWNNDYNVPIDHCIERLNKVKSADRPQGEWIPCSERLPKENGRYLVTFPSLINKPRVDILWYGRPTFPETDHPCFYASDDEYGDVEYDDVVAWMPLPKPYEEREDE